MTMRIGYLTYGLDRAPTGIGRYVIELARALAALPGAPELVLLTTEQEDPHGLWNMFEHHALPGCRLLPALMTLGNAAISQAAARYRLDVVHDPNSIVPFLGPPLGARRVATIHDAFSFVCPETQSQLDNWRYRWMLPVALRRADYVITNSQQSFHDIARYLRVPQARMAIIPYGMHARLAPVPAGRERDAILARYGVRPPFLLYVGGINARKNIARLFEAYARVREQRPDVTLVVGGQRQWRVAEIDATFRRLNIEPHVHFTGYLPHDDLPALYSAAEAFVFPSLYEGFGLPPLEAMACGAPTITSNVSSLPEVVADAALTVDPYDVGALVAAMLRVLGDAALRDDLRQRGVARAAQFSWGRAAHETLALYRQVVAAP
ncbi:glycosyltransferase family 4 protein [Kouleothrix sp.]|uniref:glycosyltransferase family 4 protein n=1 Tax=Kouleothrix sp. TaxID=2779161 RepID=UPI003918EAF2